MGKLIMDLCLIVSNQMVKIPIIKIQIMEVIIKVLNVVHQNS